MLFIELECGITVHLDRFYGDRTYSGLLEGKPTIDINRRIINHMIERVEGMWPWNKAHLMLPAGDAENPPSVLPEMGFAAELVSLFTHGSEGPHSSLVVIWYADDCETKTIPELVEDAVFDIDWFALAKPFGF